MTTAVPKYLQDSVDEKELSPGLRFNQFAKIWAPDWNPITLDKFKVLENVGQLNDTSKKLLKALSAREEATLEGSADAVLVLHAKAVAPFATGLGNKHPFENGFAFLNPYGLPYLPGSGVKGVVRQAAFELAGTEWGDHSEWTHETIEHLFGIQTDEPDAKLSRGVLSFRDVLPQLEGNRLMVEIMTPHQKHYYQENQSPHDSGDPKPIFFLAVPPHSKFVFRVQCDLRRLDQCARDLVEHGKWESLLTQAFQHAFQWLGFGAKTSVGYGAMTDDQVASAKYREKQAKALEALRKDAERKSHELKRQEMSPAERYLDELFHNRQDKTWPELTVLTKALEKESVPAEYVRPTAERAQQLMKETNKWKEKSTKKKPEDDREYQATLKIIARLK